MTAFSLSRKQIYVLMLTKYIFLSILFIFTVSFEPLTMKIVIVAETIGSFRLEHEYKIEY